MMLILITRTDNSSNKYNPGLEITSRFYWFELKLARRDTNWFTRRGICLLFQAADLQLSSYPLSTCLPERLAPKSLGTKLGTGKFSMGRRELGWAWLSPGRALPSSANCPERDLRCF